MTIYISLKFRRLGTGEQRESKIWGKDLKSKNVDSMMKYELTFIHISQ
jgi:hypothetical protein